MFIIDTVVLFAEDSNGCVDSTQLAITIVEVEIPDVVYSIPNIFTPNGDNQNDFFEIIQPENITSIEIILLNRWGNIVFSSDNIHFQWNGKIDNTGADCDDGTYFYKLKLKDLKGQEFTEHGFIHLNR